MGKAGPPLASSGADVQVRANFVLLGGGVLRREGQDADTSL